MRRTISILCLALCLLATRLDSRAGGVEGDWTHLRIPDGVDWLKFVDLANGPVNLSPYAENQFFASSYNAIFFVDFEVGEATLLKKPQEVATWNPTAVVYNQATELLYVANYTGHNVLVLEFTAGHLVLKSEISFSEMRSPEGIAVSTSGDTVAVADYDGNALWLFKSDGRLLWKRDVSNAHGVCFSYDESSLLVTSLGDRQIRKYSRNGDVQIVRGSQGWGRNQYLWPTSITSLGRGKYLACDAHTGQLSLLDEELREYATIGGNGPGAGLFNMPYHAVVVGEEIFVADACKHRIVAFDPLSKSITRALYWRGAYSKQDTDQLDRRHYPVFGTGFQQYDNKQQSINLSRFVPNIPSAVSHPGYNTLSSPDLVFTMDGMKPVIGDNGFYFIQCTKITVGKTERFLVMTCPQRRRCVVIGKGVFAPAEVGLNHWVVDGQIASDFKTHSFTSVIRSGIDRISSYDRSKHRPKSERVGRNLLGLERDERLESCFHSIEGRRFYESFRAGDPRPSVYFETVLKQRTISLLEWCLVNSFSYD